jgi:cytidylate kinase
MATITISRQMGSNGNLIANIVGERLGYQVVSREVINQAASRSRTPEVALATIDELDLLGLRPPLKEIRAYHEAVQQIMRELAVAGNVVIVGRAGQVILRGMPGVLHVRLYAPLDLRIQRVAERHAVSLEMARNQVMTSDQSRMRYLRRHYHARWDDPLLYDLLLNTAGLTAEETAAILCEAARQSHRAGPAPESLSSPEAK